MKKEIIVSIVIGFLTLILGQAVFPKFYYRPILYYEVLPAQRVGGQETQSILVKNAGRSVLNNILITLKASDNIVNLNIDGPEIMDSSGKSYIVAGNIGQKSIQLKIQRFLINSNYTLTLLTQNDTTIEPTIVSDETEAIEKTPKEKFGLIDYIFLLFSSFSAGLLTYSAFRLKRLITRKDCFERRRETGEHLKTYFVLQVSLSEKIKASLEALQSHYESPEELLKAIQQIGTLIDTQIKSFSHFSEIIDVEGACINISDKSDQTASGKETQD